MNLIDSFIVWHSKKTNGRLRTFLAKSYLLLVKIKNLFKYGKPGLFNFVNIELNRDCNRSCSYCPKSKYGDLDRGEMSFDTFERIISQLKEINYSEKVCFTGYYEPLATDNLLSYIEHTRKKLPDSKIIIYTNGDYLDPQKYKNLTELGVLIIISLHGDYEKNFHRLKGFVSDKNTVFKKDLEDYILSNRGGLVEVDKKEVKYGCIFPSLQLTIDSEGEVILCFDDYFSANKFGNVKDGSILDIWNGDEFKKTKKDLLKRRPDRDICKNCFS